MFTHHPPMLPLNDVALRNASRSVLTLDTSLDRREAGSGLCNMNVMHAVLLHPTTLRRSHQWDNSSSNVVLPMNSCDILVTTAVSHHRMWPYIISAAAGAVTHVSTAVWTLASVMGVRPEGRGLGWVGLVWSRPESIQAHIRNDRRVPPATTECDRT